MLCNVYEVTFLVMKCHILRQSVHVLKSSSIVTDFHVSSYGYLVITTFILLKKYRNFLLILFVWAYETQCNTNIIHVNAVM
jgi:hypothetical protein